jgi:hypothetical protein
MTEKHGGGADFPQDFDLAAPDPQHVVACIALPEQEVPLLELIRVFMTGNPAP